MEPWITLALIPALAAALLYRRRLLRNGQQHAASSMEQPRTRQPKLNRPASRSMLMSFHFVLTLAIIWSAALIPNRDAMGSIEVLLPPLFLTLFFSILAAVIVRGGRKPDC